MEIAMWGQNLARLRFPAMVCNGGHQSGQSAAARNDEYWICSIPTVWPAHEGHSWWWPSWYWMSMVVCFVWWAFRFWQYLESNKTYFHRCHPSLLIGAYKCTQGANFRFTIMIIDQVSRYICIRHIATLPLPGWSLARTALTVGLRAPPGQSLSLPMFKGLKTNPGNREERQFFFQIGSGKLAICFTDSIRKQDRDYEDIVYNKEQMVDKKRIAFQWMKTTCR